MKTIPLIQLAKNQGFCLQVKVTFQSQNPAKQEGGLTPRAADKSGDGSGYGESALNQVFAF